MRAATTTTTTCSAEPGAVGVRARRLAGRAARQWRFANRSACERELQPCRSMIFTSRTLITMNRLRGSPSSPLQMAEAITASSPTLANSGWVIRPAPLCLIPDSRTARASSGPRHDGVRFHHRCPRGSPRHSASSANIEANGPGSPSFSASAASRSRSIMLAVGTTLKATASGSSDAPVGPSLPLGRSKRQAGPIP